MSAYVHAPHDASSLAGTVRHATIRQVEYMEDLLSKNEFYSGHYDRLWKILEMHRLWLQTRNTEDRDGTPMDFDTASQTIDWLKRRVAEKKAATVQGPSQGGQLSPVTTPDVPAGYYAVPSKTGNNDLDFYRIDRPTEGKWAGRTFVKRVIGGHEPQRIKWAEQVTALKQITAAGVIESGQLYGQTIGQCANCHRHLTDEVSRSRGYGPDCWSQRTSGK